MQTIHSRTYTNVALTVLILLLLVLVARPYTGLEKAYAGSLTDESSASKSSTAFKDPFTDATAALREIAVSNKDIASAIRETAKSQADVARALAALGAAAKQ